MNRSIFYLFALILLFAGCEQKPAKKTESETERNLSGVKSKASVPAFWRNATVYFLLTDRFQNGDAANDNSLGRKQDGAKLRSFMGGDLKGITQKLHEGYFDKLGVTALWLTPFVEQIYSATDEGTGKTYGYHGYWARDWTAVDPNFGTEAELAEFIETAHAHGIRVLMDAVINHTGPVTAEDPQWPDNWVRTSPQCDYQSFKNNVECTLVKNLPDIRTDSDEEVELPEALKQKWESEGRLEEELAELDAFFTRTGYPRAPRFYIIKWLTDFVRKFGIDGYRLDTAKHLEGSVCDELKKEGETAFREWKQNNPAKKLDDMPFFMVGEVYGYGIGGERAYNYGDTLVDFYDHGFESLINFSFKADAGKDPETLFAQYSAALNGGPQNGVGILNYVSSHDDGGPFDPNREKSMESATKLLLAPGGVQIYYGDETARRLIVEGAEGDANLRSLMNWEDLEKPEIQAILDHWSKLGQFRKDHLAIGAGIHESLSPHPYIFKRSYSGPEGEDIVLVAMDLEPGSHTVSAYGLFPEGTRLKDYYSDQAITVAGGQLVFNSPYKMALIGIAKGE
jgi:alpha-amylase